MENNFSSDLLREDGLRVGSQELQLGIRLPWYRSLPLSVVEIATLRVDGQAVPAESIRIELNGKTFPVNGLGELTDEWWYVLDSAVLHVAAPSLKKGAEHEVELTLNLYPPYIPGLTWVTQSSRVLRAR